MDEYCVCVNCNLKLDYNYEDNSVHKASLCRSCDEYVCKKCYVNSYWWGIGKKNYECEICEYFLCHSCDKKTQDKKCDCLVTK